jgi:pimeloyl-ACP methyl ester carboxylesterase
MSADYPLATKTYLVELPLSCLHVMELGAGEPLIIVPATISELENWYELCRFMAQWFHVYFFELPGHGESSAFQGKFSSQKVAELVEQLVDKLRIERFNLMGFSFGGILAMQTFKRLPHRIDRMIMIAPCVDHHAIPLPAFRRSVLYHFNELLGIPRVRKYFHNLIHNERTVHMVVKALQKVGRLERASQLERKLLATPESTLAVLNAQIHEVFTTEFDVELAKHNTPCYFAMSIHDPILCFDTTLEVLQRHFVEVNTVRLTYPFHQPPDPFTFEELNRDFYETVDEFVQAKNAEIFFQWEEITMLKD